VKWICRDDVSLSNEISLKLDLSTFPKCCQNLTKKLFKAFRLYLSLTQAVPLIFGVDFWQNWIVSLLSRSRHCFLHSRSVVQQKPKNKWNESLAFLQYLKYYFLNPISYLYFLFVIKYISKKTFALLKWSKCHFLYFKLWTFVFRLLLDKKTPISKMPSKFLFLIIL
jgi:hypothetical protein